MLCGGVAVEDIDDYNRVEAMFSYMNNHYSELNSDGESFEKWDIIIDHDRAYTADKFHGIPGTQSQSVLFSPCLRLLKQKEILLSSP